MTDAHENDEPATSLPAIPRTEVDLPEVALPEVAPASADAVSTEIGTDVDRAPIADVGSAAFDGVETYAPDEVFRGVSTYGGDDTYTAAPALGVADAYEGASAYGVAGAYEPEGAYVPAVTPVAAEDIVPDGAAPTEQGQPARVDPIGVYVPEDVPAAALPQNEIADAESASIDVSSDGADALPGSAVAPETGEPVTPADATSGPSAVHFDD